MEAKRETPTCEIKVCALYVNHKLLTLKHKRKLQVFSMVDRIRHAVTTNYQSIGLLITRNGSAAPTEFLFLKSTQSTSTTCYDKLQQAYLSDNTSNGLVFSADDKLSTNPL